MKTFILGLVVALGMTGAAGTAFAHQTTQRPAECPSKQDWARCLWLDQQNSG